MTKAEQTSVTVNLDPENLKEANRLIRNLESAFPNEVVVAVDCVPHKKNLNPFHYVDGRDELELLTKLSPERKQELLSLKKNAQKFKVNYPAGEKAGLWQKLDEQSFNQEVDWDSPFVIKKTNGEMMIYHPTLQRKKNKGKMSAQDIRTNGGANTVEIVRFLYKKGENYYQKYLTPLPGPISPCRNTTYRLLFHFVKNEKIEFIGGFWISSHNLRLKKALDLRVGLIII